MYITHDIPLPMIIDIKYPVMPNFKTATLKTFKIITLILLKAETNAINLIFPIVREKTPKKDIYTVTAYMAIQ